MEYRIAEVQNKDGRNFMIYAIYEAFILHSTHSNSTENATVMPGSAKVIIRGDSLIEYSKANHLKFEAKLLSNTVCHILQCWSPQSHVIIMIMIIIIQSRT